MPPKGKKDSAKKKERKHLTLREKLEIIEMKDVKKYSFAKIAHDKKMNESSVRTIYAKREAIKSQGIQTADYNSKMIMPRSRAKLEMEELLLIWIKDCDNKYVRQRIILSFCPS